MSKAKSLTISRVHVGLLVLLPVVLEGCSNGVSQARHCAKTKAIVQDERVFTTHIRDRLKDVGFGPYISGGFIDVEYYKEKDAGGAHTRDAVPLVNYDEPAEAARGELAVRRCTMFLGFDKENNVDEVRIWTANHCLQPASDVKITLQVYGYGGYTAIPISYRLLDIVKDARKDSKDNRMSLGAREEFLKTFNTHSVTAAPGMAPNFGAQQGLNYCLNLNEGTPGDEYLSAIKNPTLEHSCFSMSDLKTFNARINVSELNDRQKKVLNKSKDNFNLIRKVSRDILSKVSDLGEPFLFSTYDMVGKMREKESMASLRGRLQACAPGAAQAGSMAGFPCDEKEKLTALQQKYFDGDSFDPQEPLRKLIGGVSGMFSGQQGATNQTLQGVAQVGSALFFGGLFSKKEDPSSENNEQEIFVSKAVDALWSTINLVSLGVGTLGNAIAEPKLQRVSELAWYSFHSNMRPGTSMQGSMPQTQEMRLTTDEQKSSSNVFLRWLPSFRRPADNRKGILSPGVGVTNYGDDGVNINPLSAGKAGTAPFYKRALVVSLDKQKAPFLFEKGDSGTIMSFLGFPVGALSAVRKDGQWKATEGVVLSPLPAGGDIDDSDMKTAGSGPIQKDQAGSPESMGSTVAENETSKGSQGNRKGSKKGGNGSESVSCN